MIGFLSVPAIRYPFKHLPIEIQSSLKSYYRALQSILEQVQQLAKIALVVYVVDVLKIICIGMVLGIEGLNTAIEKIADYLQPEFDKQIGVVKDISAGAVMAVSLASFVVGCMIYGPKLF